MRFSNWLPAFFLPFLMLASCSSKEQQDAVEYVDESSKNFVFSALPNTIEFAGMDIPIDDFDLQERLDKELIVNTFYHSSTIQAFKRANRYFPLIERILEEEKVPTDFKFLCLIESNLLQAVSPSGAKGFWQFMPRTAKEYGLVVNKEIDERLNIEKSTRAACQYLKDANTNFNDWILTAASYNRGMGGMKRDLESQQVDSYFDLYLNSETSRYVFRILALKLIFENPNGYGFFPESYQLYEPIETRSVTVTSSIGNLKEWAVQHQSNYKMLKRLNPWIISDQLTLKNDTLIIQLPKH